MHRRCAVESRPRAGAAADRFVVLMLVVAESEVVHRALGGGHRSQRAVQGVHHALRGFHVARHHRRWRAGIEQTTGGNHDVQWAQAAGIERNVVVHQGAKDVQHRRQTHRARRVEIVGLLRRGVGEVDASGASGMVQADGDPNHRAVVHLVGERAIAQPIQRPPHLFGGIVLDMAHVGVDRVRTKVRHHPPQFPSALFVGGDLRLQVGQVLLGVARRPRSGAESRQQILFAKLTRAHQWHVVQQHPFLVDADAVRRHRAGSDATNVGVMTARGDVEQEFSTGVVEDGGDDGHIRQVGAAAIGRVGRVHVAGLEVAVVGIDDGPNRFAHRAEMDRDVRGVGDELAVPVEQRAGEIQPLLDVDRMSGIGQGYAHLLGDGHEQIVEHLQHDWIDVGADRDPLRAGLVAGQHQIVVGADLGLPARFDQGGRAGFAENRRADDAVAGSQIGAAVEWRGALGAGEMQRDLGGRRQRPVAWRGRRGRFPQVKATADDLDLCRFHDQCLVRQDEAEASPVGVGKARHQFVRIVGGDE